VNLWIMGDGVGGGYPSSLAVMRLPKLVKIK